ncbi:MAG: hypothetical protein V1778_04950 [bacterium]
MSLYPTRASEFVTKDYFDSRLDGVVATLRGDIRDGIAQFNQSQAEQNARLQHIDERFDGVDTKLDAIMELAATRNEMRVLVHALQQRGIQLNEEEIINI